MCSIKSISKCKALHNVFADVTLASKLKIRTDTKLGMQSSITAYARSISFEEST